MAAICILKHATKHIILAFLGLLFFASCKNAAQAVKIPQQAVKMAQQDKYIKVPYSELAEYLKNTASATAVNYIEVTGTVPASDLTGRSTDTSVFGKIFKDNPTKKIALKLPHIAEENIDMSWCFYKCSSVVNVQNLPQTVINMESCFELCSNLMDIPTIPEKVSKLSNCFLECGALTKVSIIVEGATMMDGCFYKCEKLQEVSIISESIQTMIDCFANCKNLQRVLSLPNKAVDWNRCFSSCESLKELPAIPATAADMRLCFADCTALTGVMLNCTYDHLTDAKYMFVGCSALNDGGIKVPEASYSSYTSDSALEKMAVPGNNTGEQKAKFASIKVSVSK